jgi:hypothetical protein
VSDYYLISAAHLARLEVIAKRLYTEVRLTSDEMRDAAHVIQATVDAARQIPDGA